MSEEPRYRITEEGKAVLIPKPTEPLASIPVPEEAIEPVEPEPKPKDELADLFEVPKPDDNDMVVDHLIDAPEEEDLSDLVEVSDEDIMGKLPPRKPKPVERFRRTSKRYIPPPPTGIRGIR